MLRRICAAALLACSLLAPPAFLQAATGSTVISGRVLSTSNGLPIAGAGVELRQGGTTIGQTTTAADGSFAFSGVGPGTYSVLVQANGFQTSLIHGLAVAPGQATVEMQAALSPNQGAYKTIAVTAASSHAALDTSATLNSTLSPAVLQDQNYMRAGDALANLPWVTMSTSSALGDDQSISLRGFDPTESATMLDGHPIGPIGAQGGNNYDYQLGQFWGFSNINVIYGSGATGLYGYPTLAGAINFETINPTPQMHATLEQGYGDNGHSLTGLQLTGTSGKFGYALAYGVEGTEGELVGDIPQVGDLAGFEGRCPNDPTANSYRQTGYNSGNPPPSILPQDLAACTYAVDGNYLMRNAVGKITYQLDSKTEIRATVYNASMYADSPGNGDTDYETYEDQLYTGQGLEGQQIQLPNGAMTTCSSTTIAVLSQAKGGYSCLTAQQFASDLYGPQGGGLYREHYGLDQDYDARITHDFGAGGVLTLDGFIDNYDFINTKGPLALGDNQYQDTFFTHGGVIQDEFTGKNNDFAAGVDFLHQLHEANDYESLSFGPPDLGFFLTTTSYYLHDTYNASKQFSIFADIDLDRSFNTSTTNFDPRLSLVFRPDSADVIRLTGGRATSEPDPTLYYGGFQFGPTPVDDPSFNPQSACQGLIVIGSGNTPDIQPESATDVEFAAAHRFQNNATLEVDGYDTQEANPIIGAIAPLSVVPLADQPSAAYLNSFNAACGRPAGDTAFGVGTTINAAHATYRGLNLQGKLPLNRQFTVEAGWVVQSAYYTGLTYETMANDSNLLNNTQFNGIPLQTASFGVGYNNRRGQFGVNLDGWWTATNNGYDRPAYWYANANIYKTVGPITFNIGINNVFNTDAGLYGLIGFGVPSPQNFAGVGNTTALEQGAEEFALPPRQIWLTTTFHI